MESNNWYYKFVNYFCWKQKIGIINLIVYKLMNIFVHLKKPFMAQSHPYLGGFVPQSGWYKQVSGYFGATVLNLNGLQETDNE